MTPHFPKKILVVLICMSFVSAAYSQKPPPDMVAGIPVNYDETKVGTYTLPDPLILQNGDKVKNANTWVNKRRPEIFKLFRDLQFGNAPGKPADLKFNVFDKGTPVFNGTAIRKQVTIYFTKDTSDQCR